MLILSMALLVALVLARRSRAGKVGNGKRNKSSTSIAAWVSVSPNPVQGCSPVDQGGTDFISHLEDMA